MSWFLCDSVLCIIIIANQYVYAIPILLYIYRTISLSVRLSITYYICVAHSNCSSTVYGFGRLARVANVFCGGKYNILIDLQTREIDMYTFLQSTTDIGVDSNMCVKANTIEFFWISSNGHYVRIPLIRSSFCLCYLLSVFLFSIIVFRQHFSLFNLSSINLFFYCLSVCHLLSLVLGCVFIGGLRERGRRRYNEMVWTLFIFLYPFLSHTHTHSRPLFVALSFDCLPKWSKSLVDSAHWCSWILRVLISSACFFFTALHISSLFLIYLYRFQCELMFVACFVSCGICDEKDDFINWFQLFRSFLLIIRRPSDWHGLTVLQERERKAQPLTRTNTEREIQVTHRWPNTETQINDKPKWKQTPIINVRLCWNEAPRYYYFSRHRTLKSTRTRKICLNHLIWWCVVSLKRVWLPRQVRCDASHFKKPTEQ